jgi:O-antigen ligase
MRKIAFFGLWVMVFGIGWENAVMLPGLGTICRLAGIISAAVAATYLISSGKIRSLKTAHILMAAFVLWGAFTYLWTVDQDMTLERITTLLQLFAMVWLIWQLASREEEQFSLMQSFVLGCYVGAIDTFVGLFTGRVIDVFRATATNANPNELGILLGLAVPLAMYLSIRGRGPMVWVNRLYMPIALVAIFLTASRGALLTASMSLLLVPWSFQRLTRKQKTALVGLAVVTVIAAMVIVPGDAWQRFSTLQREVNGGTFSHRTDIWKAGLEVYQDHPVIGIGAGAYPTAIQPIYGSAIVAHNTALSILVENGAIGLIIFVSLMLTLINSARHLPPLSRKVWMIVLLAWSVGVCGGTWEYRKATWFLFGLLLTQAARSLPRPRRAGVERPDINKLVRMTPHSRVVSRS